jgi:hypothetical protein
MCFLETRSAFPSITKEFYSPDPNIIKRDENGNWPSKGRQMGEVSNLITDMTLKGASQSEIAKAVKHSMVVIDTEKHNLVQTNYIWSGVS